MNTLSITRTTRYRLAATAAAAGVILAGCNGQDDEQEQPQGGTDQGAAATASEAGGAIVTDPTSAGSAPESTDTGAPPILELGPEEIGDITLPADPDEVEAFVTEQWGEPDVNEVRAGCPGEFADPELHIIEWGGFTAYGQAEAGEVIEITGWQVDELAAGPFDYGDGPYPLDPWSDAQEYAEENGYRESEPNGQLRIDSGDEDEMTWLADDSGEEVAVVAHNIIECP